MARRPTALPPGPVIAKSSDGTQTRARKGRGALDNPAGRFERYQRTATPDQGVTPAGTAEAPAPLRTTVTFESARSILTRNDSPDIPFKQSINPYRGCEHGCIYCFARPSHAYLGLSPGLDFETRLIVKPDAPDLLEAALRMPGYRPSPLALGSNTDPYQPIEARYRLTRRCLEVLARFGHPVGVITKSARVTDDVACLQRLAAERLVVVCISVTTLDPALARVLEPRAARPERRLDAIRRLRTAGVPVAVLASPMIPGLNDHELEAILTAAAAAGAQSAATSLIRLPGELAALFETWLAAHVPDRAARCLNLIRACHGGRLHRARFGIRMRGDGPYADLIADRFRLACRRLGLADRCWPFDSARFRVPPPPDGPTQLDLFAGPGAPAGARA